MTPEEVHAWVDPKKLKRLLITQLMTPFAMQRRLSAGQMGISSNGPCETRASIFPRRRMTSRGA